jgi:type II secretory pathway component GspD/PulD (secretin)
LVILGSLCLGGCLAPHGERAEKGSVEDFARLLAEDATPAVGTEQEGEIGEIENDPHALADPETVAQEEPAEEPATADEAVEEVEEEPPINPYLRFGEKIIVKDFPDGTTFVTKPYPMPPGKAAKIIELLDALEPFPFRRRPPVDPNTGKSADLDPNVVQIHPLDGWDKTIYSEPSGPTPGTAVPQAGKEVVISDLLVVTATPRMLEGFEEFLDTFATGVPQIEIEAKIIEIVESDTLDVGVQPIPGTPIFDFGSSEFVRSLDYTLPNTVDPAEALLTLGAVQSGMRFNAVLEAVSTWQNVTIESKPTTVVRAGALARLESTQEIPFFDVKSVTPQGGFNAVTNYKQVGVKLYLVPRIIGSNTLALEVHLEGSQVVGQELVVTQEAAGEGEGANIFVPTIAYRTAKTVVYLEPGQTLVIGGLTQETHQEVIKKVPILGDIPILGFLFRSTFDEVRKETVLFAISPRIIQSSEFEQDL